ncbi:putative cytochrome P450 [Helianthus annuus]|uniref:Putative cytochrome P450 n=1 Tax=Helianthus annuus TaxID=4232 RepID=A0A251U0H4_HELAN|nr:cytochrome P450 71A1 [Helianthus annuus]KAJ0527513.1 putative cytochrome P450 [Helianthus annuus]KAJ0536243.1 putative cytochrome P450 [Helianthus annuus]KAJ0543920.1 putative cytochrome P450 [Helianthus annuus]KAJ0708976.1 putative cytochrome P450 [Helianthus annuus]KAJ0890065.1 putative cytochrome P450 [Helianthus annuus]
MELVFMFILLSLLLLSLIYLLPKIIKNKPKFSPPGPPGLPFIGNLHQINQSTLHTSLWQLSKSYGPIISLRFGFVPAIVVSSASLAKEVMKTQDIIFCSRPRLVGNQKFSYGGLDVAFSSYDETWRDMRKIFVTHLLSPKRIQSTRDIREDEVSHAMSKIHGLALSSKHVNLSEITKSVTSTIMMRIGFGKRYQDENERKKVLGLLNELQETIVDNYVSDIWPGLPFVNLVDRFMGKTDRLEKCFQDFDLFYQQLIDEHLNGRNIKSHEDEDDVIDILLRLMEDKLFSLTHNHIKALLMNVLSAGTDPNAASVVWSMTLLIKNPEVMKKAQEEVRNMIGKKGKIDEDDLPKLTYLKAVIKETMRLYPPAPLLLPREAMKDAVLHCYKIKQKTIVYVNAYAIGRDPEFWESPEDFFPERFLDSDIDFKGNDLELIPFGAGRRICPGMSMGVVMVELLLANLLYLFDWGLPDGIKKEDIDLDVMPGLTMLKRNELCLLAHEVLYF